MSENTNNPPAAVLELSQKQAEFMLRNCNQNITYVLQVMMKDQTNSMMGKPALLDRPALEKLVDLSQQFKEIRDMLRKQGIEE